MIMREALDGFSGGIRIGGRLLSNLRYADDIVFIATTLDDLKTLVQKLVEVAKRYGIRINAQKTKVMTTTAESVNIKVMDKILEHVDSFVYLSALISACGDCREDVKCRLGKIRNVTYKLDKLWKGKRLSINKEETDVYPGLAGSYICM